MIERRVPSGGAPDDESMMRALLWVRYGFCTGLGLAVIGLAAISAPDRDPNASSMPQNDWMPGL
jgi:hypothetical protein